MMQKIPNIIKLRHRWFELCNKLSIPAKMEMWNTLQEMYGETNRAYHNLHHIDDCLNKLDAWPEEIPEKDSIELALWFHDIIYDTKRTDNEFSSAGLVKHFLNDHPLVESVFELILATRHQACTMTEEEYILCDIDLSVLGALPTDYTAYATAVREEFSWVPQSMFAESRIKVLNSFLQRDFLFYTEYYRSLYEQRAKENISKEIELLQMQLNE